MDLKFGTPKNLDECIVQMTAGPLSKLRERGYHILRDFMAQKFGAAYLLLGDNPEALRVVETLFEQLTTRPNPPADNSQLKKE